jgi:hypothetical protein
MAVAVWPAKGCGAAGRLGCWTAWLAAGNALRHCARNSTNDRERAHAVARRPWAGRPAVTLDAVWYRSIACLAIESSNTSMLDLAQLAGVVPYMTPAFCSYLAEAGRVCLDERGHPRPVDLQVAGSFNAALAVFWNPVTDVLRRTHNDPEVATEHGAYGVAFLLIRRRPCFAAAPAREGLE